MKSVWFEPTPGRCLSFWYDMFGNGLPILYVFLADQTQQELIELWALSGSQSDSWLHAQVPIVSDKTYQVNIARFVLKVFWAITVIISISVMTK